MQAVVVLEGRGPAVGLLLRARAPRAPPETQRATENREKNAAVAVFGGLLLFFWFWFFCLVAEKL
jgi:hypothetical protein